MRNRRKKIDFTGKNVMRAVIFALVFMMQSGLWQSRVSAEGQPPVYYGDLDGNGKVTVRDALRVLKHVAGMEQLQGASALKLADLDEDGRITERDVLKILYICVGREAVRVYAEQTGGTSAPENTKEPEETEVMKMNVQIADMVFTAVLEDNAAVREFVDMMRQGPVTIRMNDYGSFEKVGSLGKSLTASDRQTTTTAGDIVLYQGNQIVMFYGSNAWSYTRIGHIDDLSGWENALGAGSITAVFSIAE